MGRRAQVHLLGLLPPGSQAQGHRRVRQLPYGHAVPPAPDLGSLRHGLHPGLRGVPRAHNDGQGVHAVRHRGRRLLACRARPHVLQRQGDRQEWPGQETGATASDRDGEPDEGGRGGDQGQGAGAARSGAGVR